MHSKKILRDVIPAKAGIQKALVMDNNGFPDQVGE